MNVKKTLNIRQMALIGLMAAVICVLAPFSLYIPLSPVPISLGSMAIYFVITVLGMRRGFLSVLIYILLGLAGLPVFTGFTGGAGKLFGPTGGYIVGYLFLALVFGFFIDRWNCRLATNIVGVTLGTLVLYLFGTVWLAHQAGMDFTSALWAGSIPYIPGDIVKSALAISIGMKLRKRLIRAGLE